MRFNTDDTDYADDGVTPVTLRGWLWRFIPWQLSPSWLSYVFGRCDPDYRRLDVWRCRWQGHRAGVVWFNPYGFEPDMHCVRCGDDLG